MKKSLFLTVLSLAGLLAVLSGCSSGEKKTLYLYNWSDYIDEELVEGFSERDRH